MLAYVIAVLITFYIIIQGTRNYSKCVWGIYIFILAIPLSSATELNTIDMLRIGYVNVVEIAILELFVLGIINGSFLTLRKEKTSFLAAILLLIYLLSMIMNISNSRCISDSKNYIVPLLFFFCMQSATKNKDNTWELFLTNSLKGLRLNAYVALLFFTIWLPSGAVGRYAFASESLYTFTIPLQLYYLFQHQISGTKGKIITVLGVVLQVALSLISQTRSVILSVILVMILFLVLDMGNRTSIKGMTKKLGLIMLSVMVIAGGYYFLITNANSSVGFVHRMSELLKSGFNTQSNSVRMSLMDYYMPLIFANPFGYGFGTLMPVWLYSTGGMTLIAENTLGVDNLFITYVYKLGIVTFALYASIHIVAFYRLFRKTSFKEKINIIQVALPILLIPTALMSVQALENLTVACFFWAFINGSKNLLNHNNR